MTCSCYLQGMRDRSMRSGTYLAREVKLTDWSMAENLSNRSSGVQIPRDICTRLKRYLYSAKCSWIIKHVIGTETCETRPAWNIHLWRQRYYHYKDTEHDVRGPRLEQSESTVQITQGKKVEDKLLQFTPRHRMSTRFGFLREVENKLISSMK